MVFWPGYVQQKIGEGQEPFSELAVSARFFQSSTVLCADDRAPPYIR
jgi:hypothetical protein